MNKRTLERAISIVQAFIEKSVQKVITNKKMASKILFPGYLLNYPEHPDNSKFVHQAIEHLLHSDISLANFDVKRIVENFETSIVVSSYILNEKTFRKLVEDTAIMALRDALNFEISDKDFQVFEEENLEEIIKILKEYYYKRKSLAKEVSLSDIKNLNKLFSEKILKQARKGILS